MSREFIRLPEFEKQCKHIGLTEDDVKDIESVLLLNYTAGDLIKGTGGIRKLRHALPNGGKSGGVRLIYIDFISYEKAYLITVYAKKEMDNLSQVERNELKKLVKILELELKRQV